MRNLAAVIAADPGAPFLSVANAAALSAVTQSYSDAYDLAVDPPTRKELSIIEKDETRNAAEAMARLANGTLCGGLLLPHLPQTGHLDALADIGVSAASEIVNPDVGGRLVVDTTNRSLTDPHTPAHIGKREFSALRVVTTSRRERQIAGYAILYR